METTQPAAAPVAFTLNAEGLDRYKRLRKYFRFYSILGYLAAGLMVLGGLFMLAAGSAMSSFPAIPFPMTYLGLFYLVLAGLYIYPSYLLGKSASNILNSQINQSSNDFNQVIINQHKLYKFYTFVIIGVAILYIIILISVLFFGASMANDAMENPYY